MILNINTLRDIENLTLNICDGYQLILKASKDRQSIEITTARTNNELYSLKDKVSPITTATSKVNFTDSTVKKMLKTDIGTVLKNIQKGMENIKEDLPTKLPKELEPSNYEYYVNKLYDGKTDYDKKMFFNTLNSLMDEPSKSIQEIKSIERKNKYDEIVKEMTNNPIDVGTVEPSVIVNTIKPQEKCEVKKTNKERILDKVSNRFLQEYNIEYDETHPYKCDIEIKPSERDIYEKFSKTHNGNLTQNNNGE